jgi:hypothetical protein
MLPGLQLGQLPQLAPLISIMFALISMIYLILKSQSRFPILLLRVGFLLLSIPIKPHIWRFLLLPIRVGQHAVLSALELHLIACNLTN